MKNFKEIKSSKKDGDYELVGEALGLSKDTVRSIVNGRRADKGHVQLAFNVLLSLRNAFPKLVRKHIENGTTDKVDIQEIESYINE